jgi:hypothetical protein
VLAHLILDIKIIQFFNIPLTFLCAESSSPARGEKPNAVTTHYVRTGTNSSVFYPSGFPRLFYTHSSLPPFVLHAVPTSSHFKVLHSFYFNTLIIIVWQPISTRSIQPSNGPYLQPHESNQYISTYLSKNYFNIFHPPTRSGLLLSGFSTSILYAFLVPPFVLHVLPPRPCHDHYTFFYKLLSLIPVRRAALRPEITKQSPWQCIILGHDHFQNFFQLAHKTV